MNAKEISVGRTYLTRSGQKRHVKRIANGLIYYRLGPNPKMLKMYAHPFAADAVADVTVKPALALVKK